MAVLVLLWFMLSLLTGISRAQSEYKNADDYYLNEGDDDTNNGFDTFSDGADISVMAASFRINEQIRLNFVNDNPASDDWAGIYPIDVDFNNIGYPLLWVKMCGSQTCSGQFSRGTLLVGPTSIEEDGLTHWPLNSGHYFAIGIRAGQPPYDHFAVSAPFKVTRSSSSPVSEEPCIDYIRTAKTTYAYGENIKATFEACHPEAGDWVGIFRSDIPEDQLDEPAVWLYTCGNQNCHERTRVLRGRSHSRSKGRSRKLQIRQFFPLTPNSYRAYLLRDGSTPYQVLAKSSIFEVEAPVSSITTDETCYLMGDSITVSFTSADPQPFDYVGFYPRNVDLDMVTDSVMWLYLCGNQVCSGVISRGQLTFGAGGPDEGDEDSWPLNVGMYRVLLLRESGGEPYEVLSAGNTFRVVRNAARCV